MKLGIVSWFDKKAGYGFISSDSDASIFVHYSQIRQNGFKKLSSGTLVEYELINTTKGPQAVNVCECKD